jgi:hypothetical protein
MSITMPGIERGVANLMENAIVWGPRILAALGIILLTHVVAKLVQRAITKIATTPAWQRTHIGAEGSAAVLAQAGKLGYWLVWLFGFLVALQPLQLGDVVMPLNILLSEIGAFLPRLIGAAAVLFVGVALSKILRELCAGAVAMLPIDRIVCPLDAKIAQRTKVRTSFALACGVAVQLVILLPIALASIDILGITAVTVPLRQLLTVILQAVPNLIGASLILVAAFAIGRWVAKAAEDFLSGIGVDEAAASIGLGGDRVSASRIGYHVILVAIMLFAFVEAARLIGLVFVASTASAIVALGGRMAFGAALIAAAFGLARIVARFLRDNGSERAGVLAGYLIIGVGLTMGLSFMGIATQIVTIAFAVVLGAAALAFAISFGLGGRQTAHEMLQEWKSDGRPGKRRASRKPQAEKPPKPGTGDRTRT